MFRVVAVVPESTLATRLQLIGVLAERTAAGALLAFASLAILARFSAVGTPPTRFSRGLPARVGRRVRRFVKRDVIVVVIVVRLRLGLARLRRAGIVVIVIVIIVIGVFLRVHG